MLELGLFGGHHGTYPEPRLSHDSAVIEKIATRTVIGLDVNTGSGWCDKKSKPFGGKVCAAETFLTQGVQYDVNQRFSFPGRPLHTSGRSDIDGNKPGEVARVINQLKNEYTRNTKLICDIYNTKLDAEERKFIMANSILLSSMNFSLISDDILPGNVLPSWDMPLMACVKSSLQFITDKYSAGISDLNTFNRTTITKCLDFLSDVKGLQSVNNEMHEAHKTHLKRPILPSCKGAGGVEIGEIPSPLQGQLGGYRMIGESIQPTTPQGDKSVLVRHQSLTFSPLETPSEKKIPYIRYIDQDDGISTPERIDGNSLQLMDEPINSLYDMFSELLQNDYGEMGMDSEEVDMLLSSIFNCQIQPYDKSDSTTENMELDHFSGKKKKKKKKNPIKKKKKTKVRRRSAPFSKKKKNKRKKTKKKKTKRKKTKKSDKIIININGLRQVLS